MDQILLCLQSEQALSAISPALMRLEDIQTALAIGTEQLERISALAFVESIEPDRWLCA